MPTWSVEKSLRHAAARLRPHSSRPRLEAEILLGYVLGRSRASLLAHSETLLTTAQAQKFTSLVAKRASGEPLPYLTGSREFYGLKFSVTPAVLIPRPETESLVEMALAWLTKRPTACVADIGTGSGCIAVTLAIHAPEVHLYASDISEAALEVARRNAERHQVAERITFLSGDLLAPLAEPVDLLISNPPYVAASDSLPASVQREPRVALLAGRQGLDVIARLLAQAPAFVRPGGAMMLEIGETQGEAVTRLAREAFPAAMVEVRCDLAGKDRFLVVQKA